MERRSAYADAVIAAGDRWREEMDTADADLREAMKVANERCLSKMDQAFRVYDEELKAAAVQYKEEDVQ